MGRFMQRFFVITPQHQVSVTLKQFCFSLSSKQAKYIIILLSTLHFKVELFFYFSEYFKAVCLTFWLHKILKYFHNYWPKCHSRPMEKVVTMEPAVKHTIID